MVRQKMTERIGLPEQACQEPNAEAGLPGHDSQDSHNRAHAERDSHNEIGRTGQAERTFPGIANFLP
jgi:hypothetical protein